MGPTGHRCFPSDSPELMGFCTVASTQGHLVPWFPQWASATGPVRSPTRTYTLSSPQWDLLLDLVCRHLSSLQTPAPTDTCPLWTPVIPTVTYLLCGHLPPHLPLTMAFLNGHQPGRATTALGRVGQHGTLGTGAGGLQTSSPWGCPPCPSCLRQQGQP